MIEFILNEEVVKTNLNEGVTLLDFIRQHQLLKGTKIGCREGDCGACTVLVGEMENDIVSYHNITSCISPLGNAQGKHIVTIEGINLKNQLNVAQKAMVENNASQCGFCTPGFVVSMTGFALNERSDTLSRCNDALSGNICRCTGYKSIEKAGQIVENHLENLNKQNRIAWLVNEGFIPEYFKTIPNKLKSIGKSTINDNGKLVANGTDLYVHNADRLAEENIRLISMDETLRYISMKDNVCHIGANTTVSDLVKHEGLNDLIPDLSRFLKLVSSEPIRNMGTLGGNFVNASPIGDMSIFFLALDSSLTIRMANGNERQIEFKKFHTDYKKYDLQLGEIITRVSFNTWKNGGLFNFEKVSKRMHLDIASVNAAAFIELKNDIIFKAHFSVGGVSATPKYLFKTSEFIIGKPLNDETVKEAEVILQSEISPISDVRGSSDYKRLLAKQLFFAHFISLFSSKVEPVNLLAK